MMARVRFVTAAETDDTSMVAVRSSQSTSTGVAPAYQIAWAVAMNVFAGRMTSSPAPMPSPRRIRCRASAPLATPMQWRTPR